MAIKLHRCSAMWVRFAGHPCWRVQKALDDQGVDYELVKEGSAFKSSSRTNTIARTGQKKFPWIEFEDGSVYREESKDIAARIRAGKLADAPRTRTGTAQEAPAAPSPG